MKSIIKIACWFFIILPLSNQAYAGEPNPREANSLRISTEADNANYDNDIKKSEAVSRHIDKIIKNAADMNDKPVSIKSEQKTQDERIKYIIERSDLELNDTTNHNTSSKS